MCILCVVQRWSRRVATMLPWLVIPLIGLWALSQLLPPGLRFEVTSPRLACVLVLLVTLFWYEILMPQLSIWRARRSARLRERKQRQAIELQKLRKTATRRCRNCLTPYRDQNPGAGRFMCSYCGHISKRPVLDIPGPAGSSGIISELVGKNGWICGQDWLAEGNGNWVNPVPRSWVGSGDDRCLTEKSYSGAVVFAYKLLSCFFFSMRWLWRKVFRVGSSGEDGSSDAEHQGLLSKKGENGENFQESKGEKARRKAEEKRQARLEKEMLEEEERKQREEVARLVEERRKLRDEKLEAERERLKVSAPAGERVIRKETEKKRHERRKEKDIGSSKSNSDGEELEKRASRESERKREFDKKSENERRDFQKTAAENYKSHPLEPGHGIKMTTNKTRYFDRMKGSFLSSSRGFTGATFFGRSAPTSAAAPVTKVSKPIIDHGQSSGNKRDSHSTGHVMGKSTSNGDDRMFEANIQLPVGTNVQPQTTVPKKAWHQLFTRSSAVSPCADVTDPSCPNQNGQLEFQNAQLHDQKVSPNYSFDNQTSFGRSLPFTTYPMTNGSFGRNSGSHVLSDSVYPLLKEPARSSISEEAELFEDPCYVPDPFSLLGPVSESLDNFPLDLGTGFLANQMDGPRILKNVSAYAEVNRPSPIESPMSRSRVSEERNTASGQLPCTPKSRDLHSSNLNDSSNAEQRTWQMWGTSLGQDGLGFVGGPASWLLPVDHKKSNQEDVTHPLSHNPMLSHIAKENLVFPGTRSSLNAHTGNYQNGGTFSPVGPGLNHNDMWLQKTLFQPLPADGENHFPPVDLIENIARNEVTYNSPITPAASHPFDLSPANSWPKKDPALHGPEDVGNSNRATPQPHIGGLFSTSPDVQSVWTFN